ncbi:hypothetical protein LCGC14_0470560 [marine sediment metagenome]|uniref:Uncharacterized protein n=1 Tax=marine sediment metagenome TaxID=412755 RepID=A0A0F9SV55_9ZZZZ
MNREYFLGINKDGKVEFSPTGAHVTVTEDGWIRASWGTSINKESEMSELFEKLAAVQHDIWASWQRWVHENKMTEDSFGDLTVQRVEYKRWQRQIKTPYDDLTESEKDSDREQVRKFWDLIQPNEASLVVSELGDLMTIRMALTMYIMDLNRTGLGNDEMGKGICRGYIARSERLIVAISKLEDAVLQTLNDQDA